MKLCGSGNGGGHINDEVSNNNPMSNVNTPIGNKARKGVKDEPSSLCEVCKAGGELICCDTCTLSFHSRCIRPKLENGHATKGAWNCAICVAASVAAPVSSYGNARGISPADTAPVTTPTNKSDTSFAAARAALSSMRRRFSGVESDDDEAQVCAGYMGRPTKSCEITVSRSGKRFVVRKTAKSQIVELDRCNTLEEALSSVVAELNPVNKKKAAEKEELWCGQCLDDPLVMLCAFCGCRKCYGKHDSDKLLVCDGCDEEWHMFCLPKPLDVIPEHAWYCIRCVDQGRHTQSDSGVASTPRPTKNLSHLYKETPVLKSPPSRPKSTPVPGRGRGRPPGSTKKKDLSQASALVQTSAAGMMGVGVSMSKDYTVDAAGFAAGLSSDGLPISYHAVSAAPDTPVDLPPSLGAPGYDEAVNIINGTYLRSSGAYAYGFHPTEKDLLHQIRTWAPIGDLELTRDALLQQCEQTYNAILLHDPFFNYKGMSSVLGEARHVLDFDAEHSPEDEDGMTDIANTDELIEADFELDAGTAATAAEAEMQLNSPVGRAAGRHKLPNIISSDNFATNMKGGSAMSHNINALIDPHSELMLFE